MSNAKNLSRFFKSNVAGKADIVQGRPSLITNGATPPEPIALGGTKESSVSKKTFMVIVKDKDEDTGKAEEARKLDIPILTPDDIEKKYNL